MEIFTIGFTKTSAENFFERLKQSGVERIIDVRLNNVSQLAGFAKRDDLRYFARQICGAGYEHRPLLAPTKELLESYKNRKISWSEYERDFVQLMAVRRIEKLEKDALDGGCLLCSEDKPHHCHRRLVAEYLKKQWPSVKIIHL